MAHDIIKSIATLKTPLFLISRVVPISGQNKSHGSRQILRTCHVKDGIDSPEGPGVLSLEKK